MGAIKPTWDYILNDMAMSALITRNLYSDEASNQDKFDLMYQIELLQKEIEELRKQNKTMSEIIKELSQYKNDKEEEEMMRWLIDQEEEFNY